MKTTAQMKNEMLTLRAMTADHADDIRRARDAEDAAAEAFEATFGFAPWQSPEHAPGWVAARDRMVAMEEADGYFWALSRLRDLEHAFGCNANGQTAIVVPSKLDCCDFHVVGIGDMPKAHPSVGTFVAMRIMGVVPMATAQQVQECVASVLAA